MPVGRSPIGSRGHWVYIGTLGEKTKMPSARTYRFTFGPWNISQGSDPFGPPVREEVAFAAKIREYKKLGFDGVQFHDDDAVPPDQIDRLTPQELAKTAGAVKKVLDGEGLFCEFVAPRL